METNDDQNPEKFSDDPQENMKTENEILKLKMQAQFGSDFMMGGDGELPPEIENAFLQSVMNFEENFAKGEDSTLSKHLGFPSLKHEDELSDEEVEKSVEDFNKLLEEKGVEVGYIYGPYPTREVHRFMRENLLESDEPFSMFMPGMTMHLTYEEYCPNHEKDIEKNTKEFMQHWEEKEFTEYSSEMDFTIVSLKGEEMKREGFVERMKAYFDAYTDFKNFKFMIGHIQVDPQGDDLLMGFSEGAVAYQTTLENGEPITVKGPYKLYMTNTGISWGIVSFVMPEFEL